MVLKIFCHEARYLNEKPTPIGTILMMEDLYEKLRILRCHRDFFQVVKMKPMHKHYFATILNIGEQYYLFTALTSWLLRKLGIRFDPPQETDDPNATVATIMGHLRSLNIPVDFAPNRLKQGIGQKVIYVLSRLCDEVFRIRFFRWKKPRASNDDLEPVNILPNDCELTLDKLEEEMMDSDSDESSEEAVFCIDDLTPIEPKFNKYEKRKPKPNPNVVDDETWRYECEKVLPRLRVRVRDDGREWLAHLEQMKNYRSTMDNVMTQTKPRLDKLHKHITANVDKIAIREKHLNRELDPLLIEYSAAQEELFKVQDDLRDVSIEFNEKTKLFNKLTDGLEKVKQQMEERGISMTDGTPLINIKKATIKIHNEISEMDVRIGVLENKLLQSRLKDVKLLEEDLINPFSAR